jgi:hypothetical protein
MGRELMLSVMKLDKHTATNLRIAFTIYSQGRNGSFWLDKAQHDWRERTNGETIPDEVWQEVREMVSKEFPEMVSSNKKLCEWLNGGNL